MGECRMIAHGHLELRQVDLPCRTGGDDNTAALYGHRRRQRYLPYVDSQGVVEFPLGEVGPRGVQVFFDAGKLLSMYYHTRS